MDRVANNSPYLDHLSKYFRMMEADDGSKREKKMFEKL